MLQLSIVLACSDEIGNRYLLIDDAN